MSDDFVTDERYAGDAAWRDWFDRCAVVRCAAANGAALRREIASAMFARLVKCGFPRELAGDNDPVAFFDSYFLLKGSRDKPKPLKAYFAHRIAATGVKMASFVCGTLFGSASGRIHDIVLDWIATLKGWKPRSLRGADGRRRLVWEGASAEDRRELELAAADDPTSELDVEPLRRLASAALAEVSRRLKAEKPKVALLMYATAHDVSITEATVLDGLGVAKSRAYAMREKAMKVLGEELRETEAAGDPLFGRVLLETFEAQIPEATLAKLGGAR